MKKKLMKQIEKIATAMLLMSEAAEPTHDEKADMSKNFITSLMAATSRRKSAPSLGNVPLSHMFRSASGEAMLLAVWLKSMPCRM